MAILFYWPVVRVFTEGLASGFGSNVQAVWPVLWFTVWQAVLSTLFCVVLGIPGAYLLYRKSFRFASTIRALISVPFMLPSLVVAIAITQFGTLFGGLNPIVAIILANIFSNYAVVVRTVGSQWQLLDVLSEEAAEVAGAGRLRIFFKIALPQLLVSIRASSALIVLYCASSYGIVLSLGGGQVNTLETAISTAVLQRLDLQQGTLLALLQIVFSMLAFTASRWGGSNPLSFEPSLSFKVRHIDGRDRPVLFFVVLSMGFFVIVPLVLVMAKAFIDSAGHFSFSNFALLQTKGSRDLLNITFLDAGLNSLRNLVIASVIAVLVGGLVSYLLAEHTRRHLRGIKKTDSTGVLLDGIFLLPIGVSAVVVGFGYLLTLTGELAWLRSNWILVPLAQSVLAIPMVIRVLYPSLVAVDHYSREQAMTDGASAWSIFWRIDLTAVRPVLKTAIAFSALVSLGEFGAASLLAFGDQSTIPMLMFSLISRPGGDNYGMALAVAFILIVITTVIVFAVGSEPKREFRKPRRMKQNVPSLPL
jgi:thiamine transport system permease protein